MTKTLLTFISKVHGPVIKATYTLLPNLVVNPSFTA